VNASGRLLRFGLGRDKPHPGSSQRDWPAHRLADRRGIRRVVLIAPHIGLRPRVRPLTVPRTGSGRRDQPRVMAELGDLARPVMRRHAPLHPDQAARHFGKERQSLPMAHRATQRHCPIASTLCTLKHGFGQIQPDRCNLLRGWLPSVGVVDNPTLAHRRREGAITPSSPWASYCRRGIRRQR